MAELIRHYDVLIIGAGPAGLAAARAAASHGACVGLVDAQPAMGGQVWRRDVRANAPAIAQRAMAALDGKVDVLTQTQVAPAQPGWLLADAPKGAMQLHYQSLVLATGARELLLPFPGWTLPGVTGAGGAQALAKQGWPVAGKRVVVAGSGPLLLASAATLKHHGAQVLAILEQAPMSALRRFVLQLPRWPGKAAQAVLLKLKLAAIAYRPESLVIAAHGDDRLREVEISTSRGIERMACDQLAVGYGLVPNTELAQLLGCVLEVAGVHPQLAVDEDLKTSIDNIFAAGEACGIGGRDCALIEGEMAGHMAAGHPQDARRLRARRKHARAFAALLHDCFALDHGVRTLATPDTVICRCEDVALSQLQGFDDLRKAKLSTRCGMGPCQGRICGTALAELGIAQLGHSPDGGRRPPLFPVRLAALAESFPVDSEGLHP